MTETHRIFVVTGVSGNTGAAAANALLAGKHAVRVVVRDAAKGAEWKAKGAEVVVANLDDRAAFAAALRGAAGAYVLLPPPGFTATGIAAERTAKIATIAGAIADGKPAHVVALSSNGAQHASGTGRIADLHAFEAALAKTGVPTTFLRAGYFMENWGAQLGGAIASGTLYYAGAPSHKFPQVATLDIGRTAAKLLVEGGPASGTRVAQITGPAEASAEEAAAIAAKLSGKPIKVVEVPPAGLVKAMTGMGASQEFADGMGGIMEGLRDGLLTWASPDVTRGSVTLEQRIGELLKK